MRWRRVERSTLEASRAGGDRADPKRALALAPFLERRDQLSAVGKDLVGIRERDLLFLGHARLRPTRAKRGRAVLFLELVNLGGERRLGNPQSLSCAGQVLVFRDGPEDYRWWKFIGTSEARIVHL